MPWNLNLFTGKVMNVVTHLPLGPATLYPCTTLINNKRKKTLCGLYNSVLNFLSNWIGFDLNYIQNSNYIIWHEYLENKVRDFHWIFIRLFISYTYLFNLCLIILCDQTVDFAQMAHLRSSNVTGQWDQIQQRRSIF